MDLTFPNKLLEYRVTFFLPWVEEALANLRVLLCLLLHIHLFRVMIVGMLQVYPECRVEHRELGDAVPHADTLLDRKEGQLRGLRRTDIETVRVQGLTHVAQVI